MPLERLSMNVVEHNNNIKTTRNGGGLIRPKKPILIHREPLKSSIILKSSQLHLSEKSESLDDEEEYDSPTLNNEQKETTLDSHSPVDAIQQPRLENESSRNTLIKINSKNIAHNSNMTVNNNRRVSSGGKRNIRIELGKPLPLDYSPINFNVETTNNNYNNDNNNNNKIVPVKQEDELLDYGNEDAQTFRKDRDIRIRKLRPSIDHDRLKRFSILSKGADQVDSISESSEIVQNAYRDREESVAKRPPDVDRLQRQKQLKRNILQLRKFKHHVDTNPETISKSNSVNQSGEDMKEDEELDKKIQEKKEALKELDKQLEELKNELEAEEISLNASAAHENQHDITTTIELSSSSLKVDTGTNSEVKEENNSEEKDSDVSRIFKNIIQEDCYTQSTQKTEEAKQDESNTETQTQTHSSPLKSFTKWTTLLSASVALVCILSYLASD